MVRHRRRKRTRRRKKRTRRRKKRTRRRRRLKGGYVPEKDSCYPQLGDKCCFYSVRTAVEVALQQKLSSVINKLGEEGSFRSFAACPRKKHDEGAENLDTTLPRFMYMFPKIAALLDYERVPKEEQRRSTRRAPVSTKLFPDINDIITALKEGYVVIMLLQNYDNDKTKIIPYQLKEGESKAALFNGHCITCIGANLEDKFLIFLDTNKETIGKGKSKTKSCIKTLAFDVLEKGITAVTSAKGLEAAETALRQHLYIQEMWKLKQKG